MWRGWGFKEVSRRDTKENKKQKDVRKMPEARINYAAETCAWCGGSGSKGGRCSACGGQGSVLVAQPARRCAWCGGSGSKGGRCSACGGTGWAHALRE